MIITRSPLRISLGGGGTDLPSYYREHSGFLIAAAIDKYVYITLHQTFVQDLIIKYSNMERVRTRGRSATSDHPRSAAAWRMSRRLSGNHQHGRYSCRHGAGLLGQLHHCAAEGPAHAIRKTWFIRTNWPSRRATSRSICSRSRSANKINISPPMAGSPVSSFCPTIRSKPGRSRSTRTRCTVSKTTCCLFFTGYSRSASSILEGQDVRSKQNDQDMIDNLHFVKELGRESKEALEAGDLTRFAELMNVHWEHKKQRSGIMSNDRHQQLVRAGPAEWRPGRKIDRGRRRRIS